MSNRPEAAYGSSISCAEHGANRPANYIVCKDCGQVFHHLDAPSTCHCGKRLIPKRTGDRLEPFTGRLCCDECALPRLQQQSALAAQPARS